MNINELRVGDTIRVGYGANILKEAHVITTLGKKTIQAVAASEYHSGKRHQYTIRYMSRHNIVSNISAEFRKMEAS